MTEKFLIVLSNRSDEDIKLVPGPVKDWLGTPPAFNGATWIRDPVPADCRRLIDGPTYVGVTSGSFENDRALQLDGMRFDTVRAALDYADQHGWVINGEYEGYIY